MFLSALFSRILFDSALYRTVVCPAACPGDCRSAAFCSTLHFPGRLSARLHACSILHFPGWLSARLHACSILHFPGRLSARLHARAIAASAACLLGRMSLPAAYLPRITDHSSRMAKAPRTAVMIVNTATTRTSDQPPSSKWWWIGAIRKKRLPPVLRNHVT